MRCIPRLHNTTHACSHSFRERRKGCDVFMIFSWVYSATVRNNVIPGPMDVRLPGYPPTIANCCPVSPDPRSGPTGFSYGAKHRAADHDYTRIKHRGDQLIMAVHRKRRQTRNHTFLDDPSEYPEFRELMAKLSVLHGLRRAFHLNRYVEHHPLVGRTFHLFTGINRHPPYSTTHCQVLFHYSLPMRSDLHFGTRRFPAPNRFIRGWNTS